MTDQTNGNIAQLTDTAPALVATYHLTPAIFSSKETVDDMLAAIRKEADAFIATRDISTPSGRAAIASFAHSKIAKSKTALDTLGKSVKEEAQEKVYRVDEERRRIREYLDDLRDEVRKPLTEWEDRDKKRRADHEAKLIQLGALARFSTFEPTVEMLRPRLMELAELIGRNWEEFADRAGALGKDMAERLAREIAAAETREREQAERERLAREEEERERCAREEWIAREARRAAEEREREAVEAARREVEEAERRAQEAAAAAAAGEERRRLEREREVEQAERDRVEQHERAIANLTSYGTVDPARPSAQLQASLERLEVDYRRDWQEFGERAARHYLEAKRSLERKALAAIQREALETARREEAIAERARLEEQARQVEAAAAEEAEAARREANKRIRNRVTRQIAEAIARNLTTAAGETVVDEDVTRVGLAVAKMLVDGEVPNVTVTF